MPMLLLGAGLGAESCIVVACIRESYADNYQRVSQQSGHARRKTCHDHNRDVGRQSRLWSQMRSSAPL